ncbi:hypothetical protein C8T65DRAFT_744114 [Cerioporus squamosus]|nr:hypothetical protein C8T65DRAFT_744114 [Cerioporus squamosus]
MVLASCSRVLRRKFSPVLFYHAVYLGGYDENDPPVAIRYLIRPRMESNAAVQLFMSILGRLPNLTAITCGAVLYGAPLVIIKRCLTLPHITSITFTNQANTFTAYEPPSALGVIARAPVPLIGFSYIIPTVRVFSAHSGSSLESMQAD